MYDQGMMNKNAKSKGDYEEKVIFQTVFTKENAFLKFQLGEGTEKVKWNHEPNPTFSQSFLPSVCSGNWSHVP